VTNLETSFISDLQYMSDNHAVLCKAIHTQNDLESRHVQT